MQGNRTRCHVSKATLDWLSENGIETLQFPPYSPDLSIIENIFGILKKEIYDIRQNIENSDELFTQLHHFFFNSQIIQKAIHKAYNNYSAWLNEVIRTQGQQLTE
ncbi:hypothetical protein ABPG72_020071 [Tetrahymena utriculariae]